jgi:ring-1,2-phenylacetyl-CoA epoxidase subunit PaaC
MSDNSTYEFALRMGDNCLVLGQSVSAWCGHAPILEEDIALANVALDLIGQTRMWLGLAGELEGKGRSADDLAFLRDARAFRNCLLVEQPNGDFGQTLMRQFLFDAWHHPMLKALAGADDARIAEIAEKSVKEAAYHLDRSTDLIIRLGDGSDESHNRMQAALDALWRYTGELYAIDAIDEAVIGSDLSKIEALYKDYTSKAFNEATLVIPEASFMHKGGKAGLHTEALGPLLADMQILQRSHPGAQW